MLALRATVPLAEGGRGSGPSKILKGISGRKKPFPETPLTLSRGGGRGQSAPESLRAVVKNTCKLPLSQREGGVGEPGYVLKGSPQWKTDNHSLRIPFLFMFSLMISNRCMIP